MTSTAHMKQRLQSMPYQQTDESRSKTNMGGSATATTGAQEATCLAGAFTRRKVLRRLTFTC